MLENSTQTSIEITEADKEKLRELFKKFLTVGGKWITAYEEAGLSYLAPFNIVNTIASGYPDSHIDVMRKTAVTLLPWSALMAMKKVFEQYHVPHDPTALSSSKKTIKEILEVMSDLIDTANITANTSSFLMDFAFFVYVDIFLKKHPNDPTVDISNAKAWSIISTCLILGGVEGIRQFFKKRKSFESIKPLLNDFEISHLMNDGIAGYIKRVKNAFKAIDQQLQIEQNDTTIPSRFTHKFKKFFERFSFGLYGISSNPVSRRGLSTLDTACSFHGVIYATEAVFNINSSPVEEDIRYGLTILGALWGFFILGAPKDSPFAKLSKISNVVLQGMKFATLAEMTYAIFAGSEAEQIWGQEIIELEKYDWELFLPVWITLLTLGFFAFQNKAQIMEGFHTMFGEGDADVDYLGQMLTQTKISSDEEKEQLLLSTPSLLPGYGTISSPKEEKDEKEEMEIPTPFSSTRRSSSPTPNTIN